MIERVEKALKSHMTCSPAYLPRYSSLADHLHWDGDIMALSQVDGLQGKAVLIRC